MLILIMKKMMMLKIKDIDMYTYEGFFDRKLIPPSKSAIKQRMRKLPSDEEVTDNDEVISGDDDVQSNQLKKTKKTLKGRERIEKDNAMKVTTAIIFTFTISNISLLNN